MVVAGAVAAAADWRVAGQEQERHLMHYHHESVFSVAISLHLKMWTCGGGWSAGAEFRAVFYFIF